MATLSMRFFRAACFEVALHALSRRNDLMPSELCLQLGVGIARFSPQRVPTASTERRRQLPFRPRTVALPQRTQSVASELRNIDGAKILDLFLIEAEKLATRRKVIVDNIKSFAVNIRSDSGQGDS